MWFVPAAPEDIAQALPLDGVRAPFLHVAAHVHRTPGPKPAAFADPDGSFAVEIAQSKDVGEKFVGACRAIPVIDRRQALAGEFRISGGLEPADASDRMARLPLRVGAKLPAAG